MSNTPSVSIKSSIQMFVTKRDGTSVPVSFDKILRRLQVLANDRSPQLNHVNVFNVAKEVCSQIYDNVTTEELDIFSASVASSMSTTHPQYLDLASRIVISNHQKKNKYTFAETMKFFASKKTSTGVAASMVSQELVEFVTEHGDTLEQVINYERDYDFTYFGFCTLEKSYLLKLDNDGGMISERPQHLWMRVAIGLYGKDLKSVLRVYHQLSRRLYIHATPTLFNAGTPQNQLASCFLLGGVEDSIEGIFNTLGQCAQISKHSGGIGMNIHDIRSKGMAIHGTNGFSNGIVPMLRVFNDTARYVDQGGGKRNGSFAVYIEPWHPDILDFLNMRKNHGDESMRARDLFYALWIPDLFMKRVEEGKTWTLMDPFHCPGLADCYGEAFDILYTRYESEGKGLVEMDALELFKSVVQSQRETGTPYMLYKDSCNSKSNQQNLGTIRSSNLCTEIIEYSSKDETAVCNLASISLPAFLERKNVLMENDHISVTTIQGCFYCDLAKSLLKKLCTERGLDFERTVSFTTLTEENKKAFVPCTGEPNATFPYISRNGVYIGGYTSLQDQYGFHLNHERLVEISKSLTRNLNQAIDRTFYPTPQTRASNLRHRPIGIGVQGLADVFMAQRVPFDSEEAKEINVRIFESIYYGAMSASCELAQERDEAVRVLKSSSTEVFSMAPESRLIFSLDYWKENLLKSNVKDGGRYLKEKEDLLRIIAWDKDVDWKNGPTGAYSSFQGSPLSQGKFQFDLWSNDSPTTTYSYDWDSLRTNVMKHGVRNSLLVAPMPTASTSQILGNNECIEPITANIYLRRTLAGEFVLVNKYLIDDLTAMGLWNNAMKEKILAAEGSVQDLADLPIWIKNLYKTVWEISQKVIIDMAAERGRFICQSQSMNLFLASPTASQLISMHFYAWKKSLKTGMYYLRTKPASKASMFTLSVEKYGTSNVQMPVQEQEECLHCSA